MRLLCFARNLVPSLALIAAVALPRIAPGQSARPDQPGTPNPAQAAPSRTDESIRTIDDEYDQKLLQLDRQRLERLGRLAARQKPADAAATYEQLFRLGIAANLFRDTNYPIPAGAYFVATNGSDSNAGTETNPWQTIGHAMAEAPSGSTIVIHGGTYREGSINLGGKELTLQPYPHEKVWLNGSLVVSNWVADGPVWRSDGWNHQFALDTPSQAIDPNYPMAPYRDMVFVDGRSLRQVGSLSQVSAGTFYADYANHRLYIGDNPAGKTVEAAAQAIALNIAYGANGTVVRGLGFEHYATSYGAAQAGALRINCQSVTAENNTLAWNAVSGLAVFNPNCTIRGNTCAFNGEKGMVGNAINGSLIAGNVFAHNNQEHFSTAWDAAGVKICNSSNVVVRDNLSDSNISPGYWFDLGDSGMTIVGNVSKNDVMSGIFYEISNTAIIASNLVVGSQWSGINVGAGSSDVRVYNNTLVGNYRDIRVTDDSRPQNTLNIMIRNNILSNGASNSTEMVQVVDYSSPPKTAEQMNVTMDYNAYYRTSSSSLPVLFRWSRGATLVPFNTVDAFRSGTGQEAHGIGIDNVAINPFFVDEVSGDYHLQPGSRAIGAGAPLPADIAAAIGVAAGVPVNLGVLTW